ncbi:hypothetical protein IY972_05860 [Campylobacter volucris]|uniref:hypothetical protein n=1 Tax=Campylobacter volucris TaxID=1031542 RepID=UPI00189F08F3|nr:hypothetical protein [Campylobacter volucris]MBF7049205.1 hypothetical protein [Campylobacter volucris]MBF7060427.1 hypothetical protein [Campylobacter volucris]
MKKKFALLIAILGFSSFAYASDGIYGTIIDINDNTKTIIVDTTYGQKINMKILPNTEIDMDDCGIFGMDKTGTFADLKIGTFIKAEFFHSNAKQPLDQIQNVMIKEIKIDCKKRAY